MAELQSRKSLLRDRTLQLQLQRMGRNSQWHVSKESGMRKSNIVKWSHSYSTYEYW